VKNTKFFALIVSLFAFVLLVPFSVKAVSMSTSPANMIMENLLPGSSYEYPITFQLQDLTSDAKVTISTELTGFDNWITFLPSKEFIYKSDLEKQIITVKVDVPTDAIVQNYKGYIRINVVDPTNQAMTSIVSGSRIDVSLDLTTKVIEPGFAPGIEYGERRNSDIIRYNQIAKECLYELDVEVNDLWSVTDQLGDEAHSDQVHYDTEIAIKALGDQVIKSLKKYC